MSVLCSVEQGVAVVTISRPEVSNAIDAETTSELARCFAACEEESAIRTIVLTGAGTRAFCGGMDLKAFAANGLAGIATPDGGFAGIVKRPMPKPVIAAVNGAAVGGGFELVLACDLVVAAEHATFGLPEIKNGLYAAGGALFRLPRRISLNRALELALLGDPITAQTAHDWGLVNQVVSEGALLPSAVHLARRIGDMNVDALRITRRLLAAGQNYPERDNWGLIAEADAELFRR